MRHPSRIAQLALAALAGALLAGGGYALASSSGPTTIHGCVNKKTHELLIQKRCGKGQTQLVWSQQGPQGKQGATGGQGPQGVAGAIGATGAQGPAGTSATILWARVASNGSIVAKSNDPAVGSLSVGHLSTGEYDLVVGQPVGSRSLPPCATTVTPDAESGNGTDQPVTTPVTASVGTSGLSEPGALITVLLNNSITEAAVDDGFSVIAAC
jgi:hypothetical protein